MEVYSKKTEWKKKDLAPDAVTEGSQALAHRNLSFVWRRNRESSCMVALEETSRLPLEEILQGVGTHSRDWA
jgi:hypothetical protein